MSLIINKVTNASLQVQYNYLDSHNSFGITSVGSYTVNIADIQFVDNNVLYDGIEAIKAAYQRQIIVARIGGDEYRNGRITSLSFSESSLAGSITANFSIEELARLNNYSNNQFASYIPSPQWLESFSETYSFNRGEDTYSFSRNISLKWKNSDSTDFLSKARLAIVNFFLNRKPNYGFQNDSISQNGRFDDGWKTNKSETIDLINLSLTLSENFDSSYIDSANAVSKKKTFTNSTDEKGYTTKSYSIELKALTEPLEQNVMSAIADEVDLLYAENSPSIPISISKGLDKDGGIATLEVVFTNDPSKNSLNTAVYSISKVRTGAYYEYTVSTNYQSEGLNSESRFINTRNYATTFRSQLKNKISILFGDNISTIFEKSSAISFDRFNGKLTENTVFSTDPAYNTTFPVLKFKTTKTQTVAIPLNEKILDVSKKREAVIVSSTNKNIEDHNLTISAIMAKSAGIFAGDNYIETQLSSILPATKYLKSDNATIETANGTTNRVINYSTIPS